jgi:hypothetical protein
MKNINIFQWKNKKMSISYFPDSKSNESNLKIKDGPPELIYSKLVFDNNHKCQDVHRKRKSINTISSSLSSHTKLSSNYVSSGNLVDDSNQKSDLILKNKMNDPLKNILLSSSLQFFLSPIRSKRQLVKIVWIIFLLVSSIATLGLLVLTIIEYLNFDVVTFTHQINIFLWSRKKFEYFNRKFMFQ